MLSTETPLEYLLNSPCGVRCMVRPAVVEESGFLYKLIRTNMRPHVEATWGEWDETWQHHRFSVRFTPEQWHILLKDDEAIGGICLEARATELYLANLHVLPEWQGQGIGTAVVTAVLASAAARGFSVVRLNVLRSNGEAQRLYERLGFQVDAEEETRYWLSCQVPAV